MQIALTSAQAQSLQELMGEYLNGEGVLLTEQGASLYVAFSLASFTIDASGTVEEAG